MKHNPSRFSGVLLVHRLPENAGVRKRYLIRSEDGLLSIEIECWAKRDALHRARSLFPQATVKEHHDDR